MDPKRRPALGSSIPYRSGTPAVAGGGSIRGPTLPGKGDKLVGDELCPVLHTVLQRYNSILQLVSLLVPPHLSHFMQVPFRTSVKLPHSLHISAP